MSPDAIEVLLDSAKGALRLRLEGKWPETSTDHWIPWLDHSDEFGHIDLCRECAEAIVEWCRPVLIETGDEDSVDMMVDGGWGSEHDNCAFCEFCGIILRVSKTDEYVESELEHFTDNGADDHFAVLEALDEVNAHHSGPYILKNAVKVAEMVLAEKETK